MECFDQRSSSHLPDLLPQFKRLIADLPLDIVERTDAPNRFCCNRRTVSDLNVVELAANMSHASSFIDVAGLIKMPRPAQASA